MYPLYSLLLTLAAIFSIPYWLSLGLRERKYFQNVRQRFGWKLPVVSTSPRHPKRFAEVAELLSRCGVPYCRRSRIPDAQNREAAIMLLDSIGELRTVYSLAFVVVIGVSFLPACGRHNPLEPAAPGKAIVFGPQMSSFREISRPFLREHATLQWTLDGLPASLIGLLKNGAEQKALGERVSTALRKNQGATESTITLIHPFLN